MKVVLEFDLNDEFDGENYTDNYKFAEANARFAREIFYGCDFRNNYKNLTKYDGFLELVKESCTRLKIQQTDDINNVVLDVIEELKESQSEFLRSLSLEY